MNRIAMVSPSFHLQARRFCATFLLLLACLSASNFTAADESEKMPASPGARSDRGFGAVAGIFEARCVTCHNANTSEGGLSLHTRSRAMAGGDSGAVIAVERPDESILLNHIRGPEPYMPPEGPPLSEQQVGMIENWIAQGAWWPEGRQLVESHLNDRSWWSLRPLESSDSKDVSADGSLATTWLRNKTDQFVLRRLAAKSLQPAPEADRQALIRRLYFDLLGLPPTPNAIERFVRDQRPDAYERLVDELLASPRYGERWARHWLDVVHYGDTHGYDKDKPRPNAWPYRDYVIRSFNDDKEWPRFVREQIAGDILYPDTRDGMEALGFLAAGPWDFVGHVEVSEEKIDGKIARHLDRDDMVRTAMQSFVGLTVGCARCHDHKFDPIRQTDYYGLQAVFAALDRADMRYDLDPETSELRRTLTLAIAAGKREIEALREAAVRRVASESADDSESLRGHNSQASGESHRSVGQQSTAERTENVSQPNQLVTDTLIDGERDRLQRLRLRVLADEKKLASLPEPASVYAGTVLTGEGNFKGTGARGGTPRPIYLLARGDVTQPRDPVEPGALSVLGMDQHFALPETHREADRRAALANWLTDRQNPLTWRNIVNRVWQYHFGRGIVETPNDFGKMGGAPSHPGLLDYLASRFRDQGQSLKELHRLMVTSAAWRQSSRPSQSVAKRALAVDADNRLLWKMPRRKLDAEAIRDSVLFVSGRLDLSMYGPGYRDFVLESPEHSPHYEYHLHDPDDPATHRRSVYRFVVRSQLEPFMNTFDCADPSILVGRRNQSLTPLQSLKMLNSGLVVTMSAHFAAKLQQRRGGLGEQIRNGFYEAIGRLPIKSECEALRDIAREHGLANACRLIFNLNEFSFVD